MAEGTSRRFAAALAVVLVAGVAAWLGYEAGVANAPPGAGTTEESARAREATKTLRPRARTETPAEEAAAPAAGTAEAPAPATPAVATQDESGPAFLDVEVVDPGGEVPVPCQVYALAEGAAGVNDGGLLPVGSVGRDGRCRLVVPSPGRYDVGAVVGFREVRHGLTLSVAAPSAQPVRVTLATVAEIRFDDHGERVDRITVSSASPAAVRFPGRGQALLVGETARRDAAGRYALKVEAGLSLRADATVPTKSPPVLFDPPAFAAPAVVSIVRGENVAAKVAFAPPSARFDFEVQLIVQFDWGAGTAGEAECRYTVAAGKSLAEAQAWNLPRAVVPGRRGTLRWSGPGIRPGETAWDLDKAASVAATIEVDPACPALKPPTVRIADPQRIAGPNLRAWQFAADPARRVEQFVPAQPDAPAALEQGTSYVIAWDLVRAVAGPVKVGAGETALEVKPAGWLVVVPDRISDVGQPRLRRADGAAFIAFDPGPPGDVMMREMRLAAGRRLGPFEPGEVAFVVETSDGKRREIRATVRAGCCTELAVPACPLQ